MYVYISYIYIITYYLASGQPSYIRFTCVRLVVHLQQRGAADGEARRPRPAGARAMSNLEWVSIHLSFQEDFRKESKLHLDRSTLSGINLVDQIRLVDPKLLSFGIPFRLRAPMGSAVPKDCLFQDKGCPNIHTRPHTRDPVRTSSGSARLDPRNLHDVVSPSSPYLRFGTTLWERLQNKKLSIWTCWQFFRFRRSANAAQKYRLAGKETWLLYRFTDGQAQPMYINNVIHPLDIAAGC